MPACPLCDSQLDAEAARCPFCGTAKNAKPKKAGKTLTEKRLAAARKAVDADTAGLDRDIAQDVLTRAEEAWEADDVVEAGRLAQGLDAARKVAKNRSSWGKKLALVQEEVQTAKKAGATVDSVEATLKELETKVAQGEFQGLAAALKAVQQEVSPPEHRQLASSIKTARKKIAYARERGGETSRALERLQEAEAALKEGHGYRARERIDSAVSVAEQARKRAWAAQLVEGAQKAIQKASDRGADVAESEALLRDAKKALKEGIFADVQKETKRAREAAEIARRRRIAEERIESVEVLLQREAKEGSNVEAANPFLTEAWKALEKGKFSAVHSSLKKSREVADEASRLRKAREALEILQADVRDLHAMKADATKTEAAVQSLEEAVEAGNWRAYRQRLVKARRMARQARKEREKELILLTVEKLVEKAGEGGVSALGARELLAEVESALGRGRYTDIDALVEAKFEAEATKKENALLREIGELKTVMAQLQVAGIEVSAAMGLVERTEAALGRSEFAQAEKLLLRAQEVAEGLQEAVRAAATRTMGEVREELHALAEAEVKVPQAEEFLEKAQTAEEEGRAFEALDLAKLALEACKQARQDHFSELAARELEAMRSAKVVEEAEERMATAQELAVTAERADIDPTPLLEAVEKAGEALAGEDPENLTFRLRVMEAVAGSVRNSLRRQIAERLDAVGKDLSEEDPRWADIQRVRQTLEAGTLELALDRLLAVEQKVNEARQTQLQAELGERAQSLKAVSSQFVRVKRLLDELSKAGIDVADSDERLEEVERAIQERNLTVAGPVLTELEEMATNVQGGIVTAARDFIATARVTLDKGVKEGEAVPEAAELLQNAQVQFEAANYDQAIELAKLAERKARVTRERLREEASATVADRVASVETRVRHLREVMKDLDRADIAIEGAEETLTQVEETLAEGDFEGAEERLAGIEEMGEALAAGLQVAAADLLGKIADTVRTAAEEGLPVGRGHQVLETAQEAYEAGHYVETLEYCKVLEDIVRGAQQHASLEDVSAYLDGIRTDLEELASRGVRVTETERLVDELQDDAGRGKVEEARRLAESLGHLVEDLKRSPILEVPAEVEAISTRLDGALTMLREAQGLVDTGQREELKEVLARAQLRLGEGPIGAATLLESMREEVAVARRLGAKVEEAEEVLAHVETILEAEPEGALESLDEARKLLLGSVKDLVEEAEAKIQVRLPEAGLEEGEWNRFPITLKNVGKAPAREVRIRLRGDVDVRGEGRVPYLESGERATVDLDVRPQGAGDVPVDVEIAYGRYFDGVAVQTSERGRVRVSPTGTYLVEDVFLVHTDGRLINHQSRRPLEEVDEDIFSGMLTVVQDFIRDSFRQRTTVGLKRLEFGESAIIIERGSYTYLACVLLGEEPKLLPLYMAEIINDVERTYGKKLERWTGLLSELAGIEEQIRKLIFLTTDEMIRGPETALGSAMALIAGGKTLGMDLSESEELLAEARRTLPKAPDRAWGMVQDAVERALKTQQDLKKRLETGLQAVEGDLSDLIAMGMAHEGAISDVERARRALARGEYDVAARIMSSLDESISALKEQVISQKIEKDLKTLDQTLALLERKGAEVTQPRERLDQAQKALAEGRISEVTRRIEEAEAMTRESRKSLLLENYGQELDRITSIFDEAAEAGVVATASRGILEKAKEAAERSDVDELEFLVEEARTSTLSQIEGNLEGREPKLLVKIPPTGLQAGTWNRFVVEVVNKGNWSATDVNVALGGDVRVKGPTEIEGLAPSESEQLELGLWPKVDREASVDVEVSYKRALDGAPYVMRDIREMSVAPKGSYPVEDALLFLTQGELVVHESRRIEEDRDHEALGEVRRIVQEFIAQPGREAKKSTVHRLSHGNRKILVVTGDASHLVSAFQAEEPVLLPLYMVHLLQELEERHGKHLQAWRGNPEVVQRLRALVHRLLLVTEADDVELGSLATNPITASLLYGLGPEEREARAQALLSQVEAGLEQGGLTEGAGVLNQAVNKGTYQIEVDDATLKEYIEIVKRVDKAINRARGKAGLELHWPVPRLAIRASSPVVASAAESFRAMILSHANAKQVDILEAGEIWRGAELKMKIHQAAMERAYQLRAKKIELILNSQDPWKIKAGIDKGAYQMGIEGQIVQIFPSMVSFQAVVPPHVVMQEFQGGVVFLDTEMTAETEVEGFANEIIRIVLEARKEQGLEDTQAVRVRIIARGSLKAIVLGKRKYIQEEVNATSFEFVTDAADSNYVVDCEIRDESFTMAIDAA